MPGFFQTRSATAPSGTTYHQINDSTYTWKHPKGDYGTFQQYPVSGQSPTGTYFQYWGAGSVDEELPIKDKDVLAGHNYNVETLKKQGAFDQPSGYQKFKKKLKKRAATSWNNFLDRLKIQRDGGEVNYLNLF